MSRTLARGRKELEKHLNGERLTTTQAALAKCYSCMGEYCDGKVDCKIEGCPLYQYMPYRDNPPQKNKKTLSKEQIEAVASNMAKARASKLALNNT